MCDNSIHCGQHHFFIRGPELYSWSNQAELSKQGSLQASMPACISCFLSLACGYSVTSCSKFLLWSPRPQWWTATFPLLNCFFSEYFFFQKRFIHLLYHSNKNEIRTGTLPRSEPMWVVQPGALCGLLTQCLCVLCLCQHFLWAPWESWEVHLRAAPQIEMAELSIIFKVDDEINHRSAKCVIPKVEEFLKSSFLWEDKSCSSFVR